MLPKPVHPCPVCGGTEWWWREPSPLRGPGGWVCQRCHPNPEKEGKMQTTIIIDNEFIAKRKDSKGRVFLGAGTFYLSPDAELTHISLIGVGKEDTCMFMPERPKFRTI